jgi:hypothetical protein
MEIPLITLVVATSLALLLIRRLRRRYLEHLVRIPPIPPLSRLNSAYFIHNGNSKQALMKAQRPIVLISPTKPSASNMAVSQPRC